LGGSCLAERLSHYIALSEQEAQALDALEQHERTYKRGVVIRREHDASRDLLIVRRGWLFSCVLLGNGSRQITRVHFPGDLLCVSSLAFGTSTDSVTAVTEVTLCHFEKDRLAELFGDHPRLAALIFSLTVAERVSLADRLASVGRTSARARVGALLCEIFTRLRLMNGTDDGEFAIPLTQEDIGDATGLTSVHVNRMMRVLADDGLIERSGNVVRLIDEKRLAEQSGFIDRFDRLDTSWLPDAR
jgi:CRP-like cAMP-binding protein